MTLLQTPQQVPSPTMPKVQPITGVSYNTEDLILSVYPSISRVALGRVLGRLCDCIPVRILGLKISHLLFCLPVAPLALLGYLATKVVGVRYELTTRSMQIWTALRVRKLAQIDLTEIDEVAVEQRPGQAFYRAGDLVLLAADGARLAVLEAVPHPNSFRRNILEARDARRETEASLAVIRARGAS